MKAGGPEGGNVKASGPFSENKAAMARHFGLHKSQVSRFAKRDDIRAFIEQEQLKLLGAVPDAVENIRALVKEMQDVPKGDPKNRELPSRASLDTLKAQKTLPLPILETVGSIYTP